MAETRRDGFLVEEIPAFAGMKGGEGAAEVELGPPDCRDGVWANSSSGRELW